MRRAIRFLLLVGVLACVAFGVIAFVDHGNNELGLILCALGLGLLNSVRIIDLDMAVQRHRRVKLTDKKGRKIQP